MLIYSIAKCWTALHCGLPRDWAVRPTKTACCSRQV